MLSQILSFLFVDILFHRWYKCAFQFFELSDVLCHEYNHFRVCNLFPAGYVYLP